MPAAAAASGDVHARGGGAIHSNIVTDVDGEKAHEKEEAEEDEAGEGIG